MVKLAIAGILMLFNVVILGLKALVLATQRTYTCETLKLILVLLPSTFIAAQVGLFIYRNLT